MGVFFEVQKFDAGNITVVGLIAAETGGDALDRVRHSGLPADIAARPTYSISAPKGGYASVEAYREYAVQRNSQGRDRVILPTDPVILDQGSLSQLV